MKKLKENEALFVIDYNKTFVEYSQDFDNDSRFYVDFEAHLRLIKRKLSIALEAFKKKTGLTPVICIVTNASINAKDSSGEHHGILNDLMMTFFNHANMSKEMARQETENSCEKYIRYIVHKENDEYIKVNPYGEDRESMFTGHSFSENALKIKHHAKKRESAERLICDIGPVKSKAVIFAGDTIADDYPMKYAVTQHGVSRIFVATGKTKGKDKGHAKKVKYSVMQQFCEAKGIKFDIINPKNNKRIKVIDENTVKFLTEEQIQTLYSYDDGDMVLLTGDGSDGFIEGVGKSADIIKSLYDGTYEREKE